MLNRGIEELLRQWQVRKSAKQKKAFSDFLQAYAHQLGYSFSAEEQKGLLPTRNLVVGDAEAAQVVFTAHYDTCAVMPFPNFITPLNIPLYILYQLLLTAALAVVPVCAFWGLSFIHPLLGLLIFDGLLLAELFLLLFGPANRHTVNDNTSGVATLMHIMALLPEKQRSKAAFVFFDLEETGMVGSSRFYKAHAPAMKDKLLINFDCVSDGGILLFGVKKKARAHRYYAAMEEAFTAAGQGAGKTVRFVSAGKMVYPSDQAAFPCGVAAAALRKGKLGAYVGRIHTPRDLMWQEENITALGSGAAALVQAIPALGPEE